MTRLSKLTKILFVIGLAISFAVYEIADDHQEKLWKSNFINQAQKSALFFKAKLEINERILLDIFSFFASSSEVTREGFRTYVSPILKRHRFIQALEWIPYVPEGSRDLFERRAQIEGFPNFRFTDRLEQGLMVPAESRNEYYPVYYLEPYLGNEPAFGFDLGSNSKRLKTLKESRDSGSILATSKIMLVQGKIKLAGVLTFLPFYGNAKIPKTTKERRDQLKGFILGVYQIDGMMNETIIPYLEKGISLSVFEGNEISKHNKLFGAYNPESALDFRQEINFSGQDWLLVLQGDSNFQNGINKGTSFIIAISILMLFIFLCFIVEIIYSREVAQEKNNFASMVSHELRTPLTPISEVLALLSEEAYGTLNNDQKEMIGIMERNIKRLSKLIDQVLNYQKLEYKIIELELNLLSLNEIVSDTVRTFEKQFEIKSLSFKVILDPSIPKMILDQDKIIQTISNFLSNAIKFSEKGTITIKTENLGNRIKFSVADQGIGIEEKNVSKLFQPFSQISDIRDARPKGTGLGLAISKQLIERQHGEIGVESHGKNGSTFYFYLPLNM